MGYGDLLVYRYLLLSDWNWQIKRSSFKVVPRAKYRSNKLLKQLSMIGNLEMYEFVDDGSGAGIWGSGK